jgi:aspartyl protease family protein
MSFSSGTRSLITEAASWAICAMVIVASITHFDELKGFAQGASGAPPAAESAAAAEDPSASEGRADRSDGVVELKAQSNGHYYAEVEINGRPVDVLIDTGATMVALTYEDAEKAGIYLDKSDFTHGVSTANGVARIAPVTLGSVRIGGITVRNVKAAVTERGKLQTTLLGMTFLGRLERVDIRQGMLVLEN